MKSINKFFNEGRFFGSVLLVILLIPTATSAQENAIEWQTFENAIQLGEENQKILLVDVWAPWCGWCRKMKKEVYPNLSKDLSNQFIWTRLNRDDHDTNLTYKGQKFTPFRVTQRLRVESVPALVILSPKGEYMFHTSGFIEKKSMEEFLNDIP